jgi:hypothetical protein
MSVFGWRWWDLSKGGALMSVNGVIWPPNDPVKAECSVSYGKDAQGNPIYNSRHGKTLILPDGRRTLLPHRDTPVGVRSNGAEVIVEGPPAYQCHCGMWAYYDPDGAFGLPLSHGHSYLRTTKVFGVVEAWGDIVWMDLGFRCEYAQVRAVVVQRGKLHHTYEIPRYKSLEEIVRVWDLTPMENPDDNPIGPTPVT